MNKNSYPIGTEWLLNVDGCNLNVRQDGHPKGIPLLLIHALAGSLRQWDDVMTYISPTQWVVRIDLLGHGESDKPDRGYKMSEQATRVATVMSLLGAEDFFAIGHSGGGNVVVALLENSLLQHRVRGAILIGTPPNIKYVRLPIMAQIYSVPLVGRLVWHFTTIKMVKDTMSLLFNPDFGDIPDVFPKDFLRMTRNSYVKGKAEVENYLRQKYFTLRVKNSVAPLLIIFGAADRWVDPTATEQWKRESRATIQLLPNVGHTPLAECPVETAKIILEFVGMQKSPLG
jgi:pimeloyl-ACP methyl ester carboxylesterase